MNLYGDDDWDRALRLIVRIEDVLIAVITVRDGSNCRLQFAPCVVEKLLAAAVYGVDPVLGAQLEKSSASDPERGGLSKEVPMPLLGETRVEEDEVDTLRTPQILRALRVILGARGYAIFTAADGTATLNAASDHHPDLVMLDLGMPHLDGLEVIAGLRGWTQAPILVVSGRTGDAPSQPADT